MPNPNILIILADDLGVDSLRIDKQAGTVTARVTGRSDEAGPVRLPNLERLLGAGIHFQDAWSHPVCTPTRSSLWTGLLPWKTTLGYATGGTVDIPLQTVDGVPITMLAHDLKTHSNYRCAMFGKWDLGLGKNPVQWGWDYFAGIFRGGLRPDGVQSYGFPPPPNRVGYQRLVTAQGSSKPAKCQAVAALLATKYSLDFLNNNPDLRFYIWEKDIVQSDGTVLANQPPSARAHVYATEDQVEDAKAWINAHKQEGPWFVALNFISPHDPLHVPPPGTFQASTIGNPVKPSIQDMLVAMIESMDYYLGNLLAAIDDQLDNTVILFIGDNGTQDIDPDTMQSVDDVIADDKNTYAVGGVHVPMIVADGGLMKGGAPCFIQGPSRSNSNPVHLIDVHRTVLEIAGANLPGQGNPQSDSFSMVPQLRNHAGPHRKTHFSQMYYKGDRAPDGTVFTSGTVGAISDGEYRLSCIALLGRPAPTSMNTYLVDEQGNKVSQPVYKYVFSRLDPEPGIPGSVVDTPLDVIVRDGANHVITDPAYIGRIQQLHLALSAQYLDSDKTPFPPLVAGPGNG